MERHCSGRWHRRPNLLLVKPILSTTSKPSMASNPSSTPRSDVIDSYWSMVLPSVCWSIPRTPDVVYFLTLLTTTCMCTAGHVRRRWRWREGVATDCISDRVMCGGLRVGLETCCVVSTKLFPWNWTCLSIPIGLPYMTSMWYHRSYS